MSEATSPTTNGTNRLTDNDPVTEAWARYDALKTIENEKDNFIKVRISSPALYVSVREHRFLLHSSNRHRRVSFLETRLSETS